MTSPDHINEQTRLPRDAKPLRVMLGWELGLNLGHLARLLPIAERLRERGHQVLAAVRDIATAASVFGPTGISFVQAPHLPRPLDLPGRNGNGARLSGYADILLTQGWADRSALWGLVQGWLNLFRLYRPDAVILDHSPTAQLAARIAGIRTILVGNGFEIPSATGPLPPFPGFSWASPKKAAASENRALENARGVMRAFGALGIDALRELFDTEVFLATFPELDHYGPRRAARYIGPLLGRMKCERIEWPEGPGPDIFACVRPDTLGVKSILEGVGASGASVVCFAPGIQRGAVEALSESAHTFHFQTGRSQHARSERERLCHLRRRRDRGAISSSGRTATHRTAARRIASCGAAD